jgi:menaquinone-dependent protoporphyrinogen oxidase
MAARMAVALGEVECRAVEDVKSVSGFDAVVVGSAIHNQAWLPPALLFLTDHEPELTKRPVWAFSVGMSEALPKPFRKRGAALQQKRLERIQFQKVPLRGHKVFSGVYQAGQMPAPLRALFRVTGGRFGDLRDWVAVEAWTDQMTAQLATPASTASSLKASRQSFDEPGRALGPETSDPPLRGRRETPGSAAMRATGRPAATRSTIRSRPSCVPAPPAQPSCGLRCAKG